MRVYVSVCVCECLWVSVVRPEDRSNEKKIGSNEFSPSKNRAQTINKAYGHIYHIYQYHIFLQSRKTGLDDISTQTPHELQFPIHFRCRLVSVKVSVFMIYCKCVISDHCLHYNGEQSEINFSCVNWLKCSSTYIWYGRCHWANEWIHELASPHRFARKKKTSETFNGLYMFLCVCVYCCRFINASFS